MKCARLVGTVDTSAGIVLVILGLLLRFGVVLCRFVVVAPGVMRVLLLGPLVWDISLLQRQAVEPRELAAGVGGEPEFLPGRADLNLDEVLSDAEVAAGEQRHFRFVGFRGPPPRVVVVVVAEPLVDLQASMVVPLHEALDGL